ncbi:MAG: hypothetical protein LLG14_01555 [Nocardiaceae bacterium]|nr:hypothetical protein [Nocardiaceae bacterium]
MRITLCAASLTAAATLFTSLPAATAAPSRESSDFTAEQQTLLSHLSGGYKASDCKPMDREESSIYVAAISCNNSRSGATDGVVYFLYESTDTMNKDFDVSFKDATADPTCGGHNNPAAWERKGNPLGRIGCVRNDGTPWLMWSNTETLMISLARGTDMDALVTWWQKNG